MVLCSKNFHPIKENFEIDSYDFYLKQENNLSSSGLYLPSRNWPVYVIVVLNAEVVKYNFELAFIDVNTGL